MLSADYLFLMTDVDCLYTANPRHDPTAAPIEVVADIAALEADVSSAGSALGTGGMSTKIVAAKLATSAAVTTVITRSSKPGNVAEIVAHCEARRLAAAGTKAKDIPPAPLHTRFLPSTAPVRDRSFWLLHGLAPRGTIYIDEGAYHALCNKAGLLAVGVVALEGNFSQQEAVKLVVVRRLNNITASVLDDLDGVDPNAPDNAQEQERRLGADLPTTTLNGGLAAYESLSSFDAPPPMTPYPASGSISGTQTPSLAASTSSSSQAVAVAETLTALTTPASNSFKLSDPAPKEVGRALVNYAATEVARIKGLNSKDIAGVLGYADSDYIALRENVSLFERTPTSAEAKAPEIESRSLKIGDLGSFA